jgi:hypothetical protein
VRPASRANPPDPHCRVSSSQPADRTDSRPSKRTCTVCVVIDERQRVLIRKLGVEVEDLKQNSRVGVRLESCYLATVTERRMTSHGAESPSQAARRRAIAAGDGAEGTPVRLLRRHGNELRNRGAESGRVEEKRRHGDGSRRQDASGYPRSRDSVRDQPAATTSTRCARSPGPTVKSIGRSGRLALGRPGYPW